MARSIESRAEGDAAKLGALMVEAQRFFDHFMAPACPSELLSPTLHFILSSPEIADLVLGGKGVGSQGDGCVQFITKGPKEQNRLMQKLKELGTDPYPLKIQAKSENSELENLQL